VNSWLVGWVGGMGSCLVVFICPGYAKTMLRGEGSRDWEGGRGVRGWVGRGIAGFWFFSKKRCVKFWMGFFGGGLLILCKDVGFGKEQRLMKDKVVVNGRFSIRSFYRVWLWIRVR